MRLVPGGLRFGLAVRLAGILAVPMRASRGFVDLRRGLPLNSERDLALNLLLRSMTSSGTLFAVPLRMEGEEVLRAALSSGQGTVIVSPHALLSRLLLRYLYDRGHRPTIIGGMDGIPLTGTRVTLPTVHPSPTVLLLARRRLRAGGIVCANVDHLEGMGKRTSAFEGPQGEIRFSDSIFRLAVRCGAQVIFTAARAERTGVRSWIAAPRSASAGSPEAVARDFAAFVQERTAYLR